MKKGQGMAELAWQDLLATAQGGLPSEYIGDVEAYIADWVADLPWDADGLGVAAEYLLGKPVEEFELVAGKLRVDIRKLLTESE